MSAAVKLQPVGNWSGDVNDLMTKALNVSMAVVGRTGDEACRHAIILMAQSAAAITKKAKKLRKVMQDDAAGGSGSKGNRLRGAKYVEVWNQGDTSPTRLYAYRFKFALKGRKPLTGTFEDAKRIGNSGLARRSWMWGLGKLGASVTSTPIPGTSKVYAIRGEKVNGYIKENRLGYISKIMPLGWDMTVAMKAANKIMKQAQLKLERKWKSDMTKLGRTMGKNVSAFFKAI